MSFIQKEKENKAYEANINNYSYFKEDTRVLMLFPCSFLDVKLNFKNSSPLITFYLKVIHFLKFIQLPICSMHSTNIC